MEKDFHIKYAHLLDEEKLASVSKNVPGDNDLIELTQLFSAWVI